MKRAAIKQINELLNLLQHLNNVSYFLHGDSGGGFGSNALVQEFLEDRPAFLEASLQAYFTCRTLQLDLASTLLQQALEVAEPDDAEFLRELQGGDSIPLSSMPNSLLDMLGMRGQVEPPVDKSQVSDNHPLNVGMLDKIYAQEAGNVVQGQPEHLRNPYDDEDEEDFSEEED